MSEKTSIDSYREAHRAGLIGSRQMQVLDFVITNEPCSQGEVSRYFDDASSSFQPRFRELEDAGLIEQRGTKADAETGRTVKAYWATGTIPTAAVRRKRRKMRATLEPTGDGLYRVRFDPEIALSETTTFDFTLAA